MSEHDFAVEYTALRVALVEALDEGPISDAAAIAAVARLKSRAAHLEKLLDEQESVHRRSIEIVSAGVAAALRGK